eukprot:TRINITY_DN17415_c1_g1_i1.p1 TRINITY_DN17415_c1_g1~~TRINITY_DN17415_c1_g1_i1.p1  ORF type:complete len:394 (+),score=69.43 TRINITY_DN17415_c1_g1_i1:41-1222(+)
MMDNDLASPIVVDENRVEKLQRLCRSETGALMLVMLSAVFYSIQGVMLKYAKEQGMPGVQVVFVRAVLQGFCIFAYLTKTKQPLLGPPELTYWVALRGVLGGIAFVLLFHAVTVLPIGDATTFVSTSTVITVLVARVTVGEKIRPAIAVAAIASLSGSLLIARPTFLFPASDDKEEGSGVIGGWLEARTAGVVSALLCATLSGFVLVLIRFAKGANNAQQLWPWSVTATIVSACIGFTLQPFVVPTPLSAFYCSLVVIFGCAGHWCMTHGVRFSTSGPASLTRSSEILYSYTWEVLLFNEHPPMLTIVGVLLIIASIIIVCFDKWIKQRTEAAASRRGSGPKQDTEMETLRLNDESLQLHVCEIGSEDASDDEQPKEVSESQAEGVSPEFITT